MSIYLSRLLLNPLSRQARSEIAYPYEMHRTLMRGFEKHLNGSEESARAKCGMLFRADVEEQGRRITVYVQSLLKPDWVHLRALDDYLLQSTGVSSATHKDVSEAYAGLHDGQTLAFRLRANPTKRLGKAAGDHLTLRGKRVGLVREEEQIAWLERKGRNGGFLLLGACQDQEAVGTQPLLAVEARREGKQMGRKRDQKQAHTMVHLSVLFDGLLRITDGEAFRETLKRGIGSAKAYGFGLLSIASPRME